jgi:choline-sulfatase
MHRTRGRSAALVWPLVWALACGGCQTPESAPSAPAPSQPSSSVSPSSPVNVLLVTFDTTRPDALGWVPGASPSASTPHLDALAAAGLRFPRAAAPVPVTLPSHTSILTGLIPRRHGVRDNGQVVPPTVPTLATVLQGEGYTTAAFVSGFPLSRAFGLDRGFDHYDDHLPQGQGEQLERRAAETTAAAVAWLQTARPPWFLWVHYYDPHDPYAAPDAAPDRDAVARGEALRRAYDGEVSYADGAFGGLWSAAQQRAAGALVTVFTADHGESLGEHGENTHGFFVYESTLAVPLVFHFPGVVVAAESEAGARLVDVAPTVLDLLGLQPPDGVDGVSLMPLLTDPAATMDLPPAYLETQRPWISYGWAPLVAVRDEGWKWIAAPRPELYDLTEDPGETTNLVESHRPKARELQAALRAVEARPAAAAAESLEDPEAIARLRALGYAGAGTAPRGEAPAGLPDPKDKVELWDLLGRGEERFAAGDFAGALEFYEQVLKEEPENRYALGRSGLALVQSGTPEKMAAGAARLERAVALDPQRAEARQGLALAYVRLQRLEAAAEQLAALTRLQPRRPEHWLRLGAVLGQSGRAGDAAAAMAQAAALAPDDAATQIRWGFAAFGAGDVPQAIAALERGAALTGPEAFPHAAALGILLLRAGREDEAVPWLARCQVREPEFAEARMELARVALRQGDRNAARRALVEAVAARPQLRSTLADDPALASLLPR